MVPDYALDHLPNRKGFAAIALRIGRVEPREASVWIVGMLLLGKEHRESVPIGQHRPAGAMVVGRSGLRAAM